MIVKLLFDIIYALLSVLTLGFSLPGMPVKVVEIFAIVLDYITSGIAIVSAYVDFDYLLVLFGIIVAVDTVVISYKVIMWIIRKIPLLGIN